MGGYAVEPRPLLGQTAVGQPESLLAIPGHGDDLPLLIDDDPAACVEIEIVHSDKRAVRRRENAAQMQRR